jgi:predicted acylesterase/phospholipase RssA
MNKEDYYVYVLPISGGSIVAHMALLQEVYKARIIANNGNKNGYFSYAPHMVFGSSGGNVAAFIGQASDWKAEDIERNNMKLDSKLFMKNWIPDELSLIPNLPFALFKGSLYNKGDGACCLFEELFTSEKIQRSEMWLGTYDIKNKKAQFFCNRSQATAEITESYFNEEQSLYHAMPLIYINGDLNKLGKVCIASATIPTTVPLQEIDGELYADGGVMYSSPLTVLRKEISRIISGQEKSPIIRSFQVEVDNQNNIEIIYSDQKKKNERNLRMFYFFPHQPNGLRFKNQNNDLAITSYLDSILNVSMMNDRNTAIELLNDLSPEGLETEIYNELNTEELANILKLFSNRKHYVICLYPHRNPSVPISNINGKSMINAMAYVRKHYGCQIWCSKNLK